MGKRDDAQMALAAMAAAAGTGYASGRELVLFFAQLGRAGWIGVALAPVVFGLLTAMLCRLAARAGGEGLAGMFRGLLGPRAGAVAGALQGTLLALTAVVMLWGAGELGALALPLRFGFLWGAGLALLAALLLNLGGMRALPWAGLAVMAVGVALYAGLALDARPPRIYLRGDVRLALEGSVPAAILLALAYGSMNACLAAAVAARFGGRARPLRAGALCGAMLFALLLCANLAVARGGRQLLCQAMPTVVLAARWGLAGFWLCVGFGFLCAVSTLAATLGGLIGLLRTSRHGLWGVAPALLAAAACALRGVPGAVSASYPAVGWLCAALMLAMACRMDSGLGVLSRAFGGVRRAKR